MNPLNEHFVERINAQYPEEAQAFIEAIEKPVVPSVRMHPVKGKGGLEGCFGPIALKGIPWNEEGYWLSERPNYTLNTLFHTGVFYPQEASSMVLQHVLKSVEGLLPKEPVVLDLCAAPGGKTTLLASWMNGNGVLLANEYVRQRSWILRENVAKWGYGNCVVTNCEAGKIGALGATFDLALIDAPCSGEGMFRKDDVARTEWSLENAKMCVERQRDIINDVWDAIAEDAVVIYSTCTFNPEENELQMEWLASEYDVEFIDIDIPKEWNVSEIAFSCGRGYAFHPHKVDGEGFFVSVMRKRGGMPKRRVKLEKKTTWTAAKIDASYMQGGYTYYQTGEDVYALPIGREVLMSYLSETLKAIWVGAPIGKQSRKELLPAGELALQVDFNPSAYAIVELNAEESLRFLRGEWTYSGEMSQGWNVVRYEGHYIGFVKVIGTRVNNYWPKEWRIRMDF